MWTDRRPHNHKFTENFKERDLSAKGCVWRGDRGVTFYTKRLEKASTKIIFDLWLEGELGREQGAEGWASSKLRMQARAWHVWEAVRLWRPVCVNVGEEWVAAEERRWEWEGARHCSPLKDFGFYSEWGGSKPWKGLEQRHSWWHVLTGSLQLLDKKRQKGVKGLPFHTSCGTLNHTPFVWFLVVRHISTGARGLYANRF